MNWGTKMPVPPALEPGEREELLSILRSIVGSYGDIGLGENRQKAMDYLNARICGEPMKSPRDAIMSSIPGASRKRSNPMNSLPPSIRVVIECLTAAETSYSPHWWLWCLPVSLQVAGKHTPPELASWAWKNKVDIRAPWKRGAPT